MNLTDHYKFLEILPNPEILNFNFSTIPFSDVAAKKLPHIFSKIDSFGILKLEIAHWDNAQNHNPVYSNVDHAIHPLVLLEVKKLEKYYNASAKMAYLARMSPGAEIDEHYDDSPIFAITHRVHLPLVTSSKVDFWIGGTKYHFYEGRFFEFNNRLLHRVVNNSDIYRIHLIIDLLPNKIQGEQI